MPKMEAFISGAWRTPARGEVLIGGTVRRITRGEVYRSDAWRSIVSFIPPLTLTATPSVSGRAQGTRPANITTNLATATPSGGAGPYSYAWAIISGDASIDSPNTASTTFSSVVSPDDVELAIARVTCTDSVGNVASAQVSIRFANVSNQ